MKPFILILFMIILASLMISLISCAPKSGHLGEDTIEFDNFDFSTPVTDILPEHYIHPDYGKDCFSVPSVSGSNLYYKEICCSYANEALWLEYRHFGSCSGDEYLSMAGRIFNAANFATTLDGRVFLVGGKINELTQTESDDFIARLGKRYGEPIHSAKSFFCDHDLYTWTLEDRTLKYAVATTDESSVLKIEMEHNEDGELTDLREGIRKSRLIGSFFVIDTEWKERFLTNDHMVSGDFCNLK